MKKVFFLSFFALILFLLLIGNFTLAQGTGRPLEITYPKIPNVPTPETIATGLPEYVSYLFYLAVTTVGFVIFGVLIYNGIYYLTSSGNPDKLRDARAGIFYAFCGAFILLGSWILFTTINPQLTIFKLHEITPIGTVIPPGVYVCNYTVNSNLASILNRYIQKGPIQNFNVEDQIDAAKDLRKIIYKSKNEICYKLKYSGNFKNFKMKTTYTMFIIPSIKIIDGQRIPFYDYGLILHEEDDQRGRCKIYVQKSNNFIYTRGIGGSYTEHQFPEFRPKDLNFEAESFTVFQRPPEDPPSDAKSVTLYICHDKDRLPCPPGVIYRQPAAFKNYGEDFKEYDKDHYLFKDFIDNTRSVDPHPNFITIFFDNENLADANCAIVKTFRANAWPMGSLKGIDCSAWDFFWGAIFGGQDCRISLKKMIVIKGIVL